MTRSDLYSTAQMIMLLDAPKLAKLKIESTGEEAVLVLHFNKQDPVVSPDEVPARQKPLKSFANI